jgi:hypothetical protein
MSPRKSKFETIEALVCRDLGRGTRELIEATRGELEAAARTLATATNVGLITGFFVPRGDVAAPETDGPPGAALLAASMAACGVPARIAVDSPCADAVRAAVAAAHGHVEVDEVGVVDRRGIERVAAEWRGAGVSHVIAIERCGIAAEGRPRNMRGVDVSPWTAPLDDLFLDGSWRKIAVGDGGNEIGMGKLPSGLIARHVPNGELIACVTSCDHLIVAGVSNWGAYGLMAALAVLRAEWSPVLSRFLSAERDLAVTRAMVTVAGAVDGVTAQREATVDGLGPEIHGDIIDGLRRIAWEQGAD